MALTLDPFLEVRCTYNLSSNCSDNPNYKPQDYSYPRYNWVKTTVTKWVISTMDPQVHQLNERASHLLAHGSF